MTTTVNRLYPGDAFRIELGKFHHVDYRLIYVNSCRAYVEPLRKKADIDILENSPGGRTSITPNCECEIIDEELEIMMKPTTTTTAARTETVNKMIKTKAKRGSGGRRQEPRKQERPIREGTIRAKLLAAIEGGNTSVPKLMKQLGMTKPVLFSHINEFWRAHGYGYSITDDIVRLIKPIGGAMKHIAAGTKPKTAKKPSKKAADPFEFDDEDPLA